ncbi:hypothetical protein BH09BAC2_BH09BAC2_06140 [soil metagenome]
MKKLIAICFVTFSFFLAPHADAQLKKFRIGLGLEAALPVSNLDAYSVGGGLTIRAEVRVMNKLAVTLTSGAMAFQSKDYSGAYKQVALLNIPIKAGAKYTIVNHFYGMMELGVTQSSRYYKNATNDVEHVSEGSSFTYAPGLGLQLAGFDLGLRYEGFSKNNVSAGFLGFRAGFSF